MTTVAWLAATLGLVVALAAAFLVLLLAEGGAEDDRPITFRFALVASCLAMLAVAVASILPTVVLG